MSFPTALDEKKIIFLIYKAAINRKIKNEVIILTNLNAYTEHKASCEAGLCYRIYVLFILFHNNMPKFNSFHAFTSEELEPVPPQ